MVENVRVAQALNELADLMELSGESTFKVRALRGGARAVEGLAERVVDLVRQGTLEDTRGIGEGVARRIRELLDTGKLAESETLKSRLPPGVFELMNLPGIGLKTAQQVWQEYGISSIDQLEAAARSGKLRGLPRFGEKREAKLLEAIEAFRKRAALPPRRPFGAVMTLAQGLCDRLRAMPGVIAVEPAGSFRRRAEMVGDLDVLVAADAAHAPAIMSAFVGGSDIVEVLAKGDTKSSVVLHGGLQADLRVVPPASFGAALQYFTGSRDHNVAVRTLAVRRGLKVSEYGVFDDQGNAVAGADEQGVYEALGLAWMPPELRENRGEVEAAAERRLPRLVEPNDIVGDLHMHTTETDGRSTLQDMATFAFSLGRSYVAITDHSESLKVVRGMTRDRLQQQVRRVRELDERLAGKPRVLVGIEADILPDGRLDLQDELDQLDWVVGSVHVQLGMPRAEMTKRVVRAIESGKMDCLGHPTGRQLGYREPSEIDFEVVFAALRRTGVAIELNSSPLRLDVDEHLARMARDLGVPVVINSDAHSVDELHYPRLGVGIARRAWLGPEHVLNTRTIEQVRAFRQARTS